MSIENNEVILVCWDEFIDLKVRLRERVDALEEVFHVGAVFGGAGDDEDVGSRWFYHVLDFSAFSNRWITKQQNAWKLLSASRFLNFSI